MLHVNDNFEKLVNKAEKVIMPWFSRGLTIYGRILLVKYLLSSLLQYAGQVYIMQAKYIKLINDMWKFVNKGKKEKVQLSLVYKF